MARTPSTMIPLGTIAPEFALPDVVSGEIVRLSEVASSTATVVFFICNHCPFVKHVATQLAALGRDYQPAGVSFLAISSNDVERYPDDSPENMKSVARAWEFTFPYLYDESQEVARSYDAACTPDCYIFDGSLRCVYRGQLDDSRPDNGIPVSGNDIRVALDAMLRGEPVPSEQRPSLGCNIKWKE